jgi:hypothetical protein
MNEPEIRERLVRLETEMEHITAKLDDVSKKVTLLVDLLNQARGARWAIGIVAALIGFAAAKIAPFIGIMPR